MGNLQNLFETNAKYLKRKNAKEITFVSDGKILKAKAVRYDDAFYEIVGGQYDGNLVHIFDLVKNKV